MRGRESERKTERGWGERGREGRKGRLRGKERKRETRKPGGESTQGP